MAPDISAVTPPAPDPKTGKPKVKSEIAFPYYSLDKSLDVPRVLHEKAGGQCGRSQLAPLLGYSGVKNGGFLTRISAAKMFGLAEEYGDSVMLTERAREILYPVTPAQAERAKFDAFMSVELFRRVFESYEGQTLPSPMGLKNLFQNTYKVVPKQVDSALRVLMDSADAAGLFKLAGKSKMVKPIFSSFTEPVDTTVEEHLPADPAPDDRRGGGSSTGSGGGGGNDGTGIHPALLGLLRGLPPIGQKLPPKRRTALIEAFKSTVNFVWPEEEDDL
jgi:hypothetical protein